MFSSIDEILISKISDIFHLLIATTARQYQGPVLILAVFQAREDTMVELPAIVKLAG